MIQTFIIFLSKKSFLKEKRYLSFIILLSLAFKSVAQLGGSANFEYVNLSSNAKLTALGGINVSATGKDINMFITNPSLLVDSIKGFFSVSYGSYYANTVRTNLVLRKVFRKIGTWGLAFQNLQYGDFDGFSSSGKFQGTFTSQDLLVTLANAYRLNNFALGASVKFAQSTIENYQATALFFDMSGTFIHPEKSMTIGLVIKNFGFPLKKYQPLQSFTMPFDIQAGISFKPQRMPLNFSFTAHHLFRFDIAYQDPTYINKTNIFGNSIGKEVGFFNKLSRHFVIASELIISDKFQLRAGYNFLRRNELKLTRFTGLTGFSFGLMINIKRFEFNYGSSIYHTSEIVNHFTLTINDLSFRFKKKKIVE